MPGPYSSTFTSATQLRRVPPSIAAFLARDLPRSECWEWPGPRNSLGYGRVQLRLLDGSTTRPMAHRVTYALLRGDLPPRAVLDHLCRNRACVNPWHVEAVDQRTNLLRGDTVCAAVYQGVTP